MKIKKHQSPSIKKFKFQRYQEIGSPDAETDRLLIDAFIEKDALVALLNMSNQRSILIGRTGSGKSAILKYIEYGEDLVHRIEPEAMSLRFLSNSNMLDYFRKIDVNLTFFYKILWKHVFVIELLALHFSSDSQKKNNWITALKDKISTKKNNEKRERAINYFEKYSKDFWLNTEKRIKEIENVVHSCFETEVGASIVSLRGNLNEKDSNQESVITEIKYKAEHVISEALANDIHEIINILKEDIFTDTQQKHFIIIDDLDKEWIPSTIRYELIGSMIEVIKEFQEFQGVKIIISLRDNLFQLVFAGAKHRGGQREKFKPLYVNLAWNKDELKCFLEKRLSLISDDILDIKTAFEKISRDGKSGFDYMLERTFYRPRDIISYVNHAIENANNKAHFTSDIIKKAEISYSEDRLQAIEDEWGENYGEINTLIKFLIGKVNGFRLHNIKEDEFYHIFGIDSPEKLFKGLLSDLVSKWNAQTLEFQEFLKEIIHLLYQIGILGIKKSPQYPIMYSYEDISSISITDINSDCRIYIHPAFFSALKVNVKAMEIDRYGYSGGC